MKVKECIGMPTKVTYEYNRDRIWEHDKAVDNVRLRLPAGWYDAMKTYVDDNRDRYHSVNDLIKRLIERGVPGLPSAEESAIEQKKRVAEAIAKRANGTGIEDIKG